jgi:hypothetical protein
MMIDFVDVSRDSLYYDQYQYSVDFRLDDAGRWRRLFKNANESDLKKFVENLPEYSDVGEVAMLLAANKDAHKSIIYGSWIYVYTNNLTLLEDLASLSYYTTRTAKYNRCVIDREKGVVVLGKTQHQYRTYLRGKFFDDKERERFIQFFANRPDYFRITPGLQSRLIGDAGQRFSFRNFYTNDWNFIDHHDINDALMLNLILPGIVRKTVPIQAK